MYKQTWEAVSCSKCGRPFECVRGTQAVTADFVCPRCFMADDQLRRMPMCYPSAFYCVPISRLGAIYRCRVLGEHTADNERPYECFDCHLRSLQNDDGSWSRGIHTNSFQEMCQAYGVNFMTGVRRLEELSDRTCPVLSGR